MCNAFLVPIGLLLTEGGSAATGRSKVFLNRNITEYYMNRRETDILNLYANSKAFPELPQEFHGRAKAAWKELIKLRYARLQAWWSGLSKTERKEYKKLFDQRFVYDEEGRKCYLVHMERDIVESVLEFSGAFKASERTAPIRLRDRHGYNIDLYYDLRQAVWSHFVWAYHLS